MVDGVPALWSRLRRNFSWKVAADASRAATFAYFAVLARWLGPQAFGEFSLLFAVAMITGAFADLGLNTLLTRNAARDKTAGPSLFLKTLYFKAAAFAVAAAAAALAAPAGRASLWLLFVGIAFSRNLIEQASAYCLANERVDIEAALKGGGNLLLLAAGFAGLGASPSVETAAAFMLAAHTTAAAAGFVLASARVRRIPGPRGWPRPGTPGSPLAEIAALAAVHAALNSFSRIDVAALRFFSAADAEIGKFFAAERVVTMICVLPGLLAMAALPVLTDIQERVPGEGPAVRRRLLKTLWGAGLLAAAALALAADPLVRLLYGSAFPESASLLRWLSLGIPFMFVNHMHLNALIAAENSGRAAATALAALAVNAALLAVLVPRMGAPGAALSAAGGQAALSLFAVWRPLR